MNFPALRESYLAFLRSKIPQAEVAGFEPCSPPHASLFPHQRDICPLGVRQEFTQKDVERFIKLVEVLPSGCWYWLGARSRGQGNRKFYGTFKVNGVAMRAHRFAAEALGGKILPPGYHRDHTCNFSMCVNPAHIEIVTPAENEKRKKERRAKNHVR